MYSTSLNGLGYIFTDDNFDFSSIIDSLAISALFFVTIGVSSTNEGAAP